MAHPFLSFLLSFLLSRLVIYGLVDSTLSKSLELKNEFLGELHLCHRT